MRMDLFDFGQTLEDHDVPLPGALQALEDMSTWRDADGNPVLLALGWDFDARCPTVLRRDRKPGHPFVFRVGKRAGNAVR